MNAMNTMTESAALAVCVRTCVVCVRTVVRGALSPPPSHPSARISRCGFLSRSTLRVVCARRRRWFPTLRAAFPEALADVSWQEFVAAINAAEPGFIRVEADELTYDFHIMLRTELEAQLLSGDLDVADIPAAWNAAVKETLGVDVPDDARGCLQDIHWSGGYMVRRGPNSRFWGAAPCCGLHATRCGLHATPCGLHGGAELGSVPDGTRRARSARTRSGTSSPPSSLTRR